MLKKNKLRYNEYYDMQHIYDELYAQSKNGNNFYKLLEIIGSEQNICLAYRNLKSNSGSKTAGTDGMTIDCNDNLWVAQWGGGGVYCYNPYTGDLLTKIVVPAPHVASCAFGGDKLDTLYITTARAGLSEEQLEEYPLSGSVFCCKPGAKGVPANCFH
jgi:sugar lactone lactonase YvrE